VIVIGFCLLASFAQKNKARDCRMAAAELYAKRLIVNLSSLRLMQQGQATFPSIANMARPATTRQPLYCLTLLSSCDLGCDETNVIDAGLMTDVENIRHRREVEGGIALDEHNLLGTGRENSFQLIQ